MIVIPRAHYDEIIDLARESGELEICGILGGHHDPNRSVVESVHPTANAAAHPRTRYEIDPEKQLSLIEEIEARGQAVVGYYHSHPNGPPRPSATDAEQATWDGYSYVIVSMDGEPYVGSWRWDGTENRFRQELVVLKNGT